LEIPRGRRVLKAKLFKGVYCMSLNWNFQRGGEGLQPKKLLWREYGYFLEQHYV